MNLVPQQVADLLLPRATDVLVRGLLTAFAAQYRFRPSLRKLLRTPDGWLDFSVGLRTASGSVARTLAVSGGRLRVLSGVDSRADAVLTFTDEKAVYEMLSAPTSDLFRLVMNNRVSVSGNTGHLQVFNFLVSRLLLPRQIRMLRRAGQKDAEERKRVAGPAGEGCPEPVARARRPRMSAPARDPGVIHLEDPYLPGYGIEDFPRLAALLARHLDDVPQVCEERPLLLTRFLREHGKNGMPPVLRQGRALAHLLGNKKPLVAGGALLPGTTTAKTPTGVLVFPDAQGGLLWGELLTAPHRPLNPYRVSGEAVSALHHEVFPFHLAWSFYARAREANGDTQAQRINERLAAYFVWKTVGISHTVPDFTRVLAKGMRGLVGEIRERGADPGLSEGQRAALSGMEAALAGVMAYAENLSAECRRLAEAEVDLQRKQELLRMARALARVPRLPARSLYEAVLAVWITWISLHNENTNTGLSLGRLDQVFQPFFRAEMDRKRTKIARNRFIRDTLALLGDFFLRLTDHVPLVPDIGNHLFGGSSSDQAITLGGVTEDGGDAVCDMSYLMLKVTEMLGLRDPNMNARFCPGVNSDAWLTRLCEVNHATGATPSLHNDLAVFAAWKRRGVPLEHLRDWSATGCVEPTISGRHMGHTGSILFNLVAPLEMALGNGVHPLLGPEAGPETGDAAAGAFPDFESFFAAYQAQLFFLQDRAAEYNRNLARAHAEIRPTPLISALISGCVENAADATSGGALYNTSGTSNIGLADVADSLAAVKKLVFEDRALSFEELMAAAREGLAAHPRAAALLRARAPRFGSGDPDAMAMAERVAGLVRRGWDRHVNFRGGPYTTGFWSMSQHVAYGLLSGALPSGRPARTPFTPGLTPCPAASRSLLDNLRDVARLSPENLDNNVAFNVKIPPGGPAESESTIRAMAAYARAYFDMGGMQMQMNVVDSKTLKDAMARPEAYKSLLVRISGYNAYFTTLNRDMQLELVHRAEYGV